jgi:hypothetical protein
MVYTISLRRYREHGWFDRFYREIAAASAAFGESQAAALILTSASMLNSGASRWRGYLADRPGAGPPAALIEAARMRPSETFHRCARSA